MEAKSKIGGRTRRNVILASATAAVVGIVASCAITVWRHNNRERNALVGYRYDASGYGGFVPDHVDKAPAASTGKHNRIAKVRPPVGMRRTGDVAPVVAAYNAGHYAAAEAKAQTVIAAKANSHSVADRQQAAMACQIEAYAAARRHDFKTARERFAELRTEASTLPDGGRQAQVSEAASPTLQVDAAYEHAVCTEALGDTPGAEKEFTGFMKDFPSSPLLHAALWRIQRLHNGTAPPAEEAVWKNAVSTVRRQKMADMREHSMCGPQCLAELLRRAGKSADVHRLADEMKTNYRGTTMADLADVADHHGFACRGYALTLNGLKRQSFPAIALLGGGHYVIVDGVTAQGVKTWDPDGVGAGHGRTVVMPNRIWNMTWHGDTLALAPSMQTASR